ncbi:hypothetical protein GGR21_002105 [Dysgonomonas hofstadii]|uniref:DUF4251 domain-containing protein n=1 Tax=Dysgonomonas hofstadii TaxID=637886 RepID=A0A840CRI5_9BACT|nr:hypothetical protein [Dysgonomonas hofstadii]MBB4036204.1 hypothetical protein [Dysgonomonas hofstadii]
MKKIVKSLVFLLFCLMILPVGLLAQDKTNVDLNESAPVQVKNITVYFKPEKFERSKIDQSPEYLEGPYYLSLADNVLTVCLPLDRKGVFNNDARQRYQNYYNAPTIEMRDELVYEVKPQKDGGYIIDIQQKRFDKFKVQYFYSLNIDKDGYGTVTLYHKTSENLRPRFTYYGEFSCQMETIDKVDKTKEL